MGRLRSVSALGVCIFLAECILGIGFAFAHPLASSIVKGKVSGTPILIQNAGKEKGKGREKGPNGKGDPGDKGKKVGQVQAESGPNGTPAVGQVTNFLDREIESKNSGTLAAARSGANQYAIGSNLSVFTVSGASFTTHQGFQTSSILGQSRGPSFNVWDYGVTLGARLDVSSALGLSPKTLVIGSFGNYTRSDIHLNGSGPLSLASTTDDRATLDSFGGGGFALATVDRFYVLAIGAYTAGSSSLLQASDVSNPGLNGTVTSGSAGTVVPLWSNISADFRGTLSFSSGASANSTDTNGLAITKGEFQDLSGSASVKVFSADRSGTWTFRPFAQAGYAQHLSYTNRVAVDSVLYNFSEEATSVFGRAGIDIEQADGFQSYIALRGDLSSDRSTVAGQLGLTLKLN